MKRCQTCLLFNNGEGSKTCLKCSYYKHFCLKATPRSKIPIDIVPDAILIELADTSDEMPCVLTALKQLPDDLSLIISARFVAGISAESLAGLLHISIRQVERRQALGLSVIKKLLRKDIIEIRKKHVGRDVICNNIQRNALPSPSGGRAKRTRGGREI